MSKQEEMVLCDRCQASVPIMNTKMLGNKRLCVHCLGKSILQGVKARSERQDAFQKKIHNIATMIVSMDFLLSTGVADWEKELTEDSPIEDRLKYAHLKGGLDAVEPIRKAFFSEFEINFDELHDESFKWLKEAFEQMEKKKAKEDKSDDGLSE